MYIHWHEGYHELKNREYVKMHIVVLYKLGIWENIETITLYGPSGPAVKNLVAYNFRIQKGYFSDIFLCVPG